MGLLDSDIAGEIAAGFDGLLLAGTLTKITPDSRDPANGDVIPGTSTNYAVQGFIDAYSDFTRLAAGIPATNSKVTLIAGLCAAEPAVGDEVTLGGKLWHLLNVDIDPASATYICQGQVVQS